MSLLYRKRTIHMPEYRAQQVAFCAARLDVSSEAFIQACITAGILATAADDDTLALMLLRAKGVAWDDLEVYAKDAGRIRELLAGSL